MSIHYRNNVMEYLENAMETLSFANLICLRWPGTSRKQVLLLLIRNLRVELWTKMQFATTEIKNEQLNVK